MRLKRSLKLFEDTSPAAEEKLIELLRAKSAVEKVRMVNQINTLVRTLIKSDLKQRFPDVDEAELKRKLAERLIDDPKRLEDFIRLFDKRAPADE